MCDGNDCFNQLCMYLARRIIEFSIFIKLFNKNGTWIFTNDPSFDFSTIDFTVVKHSKKAITLTY